MKEKRGRGGGGTPGRMKAGVFLLLVFFFLSGLPLRVFSQSSPDQRASVVGTVLTPQGLPVKDIEISARDKNGHLVARATTNEKGEYLLECLDRDQYQLTLDPGKTGFQGQTAVADLLLEGLIVNWMVSAAAPAIMVMQPGTCCWEKEPSRTDSRKRANVVGVVLDIQGKPVKDVEVLVQDQNNQTVARTLTNEKGEYLLKCLEWGQYALALNPLASGFLGKTLVTSLGLGGAIVEWKVSTTTEALVTARPGTCCRAAVPLFGLGALGAVGVGVGTGVAVGVIDDSPPRRHPASPSQ